MEIRPVRYTAIPELGEPRRGKVRDVYDVGDTRLLIVTTDRISTYDVVHPTPVPGKGVILNQLSNFWMRFAEREEIIRNHLIETETDEIRRILGLNLGPEFDGRTVYVVKADTFPAECIVRGYLVGSGWKDYQETGKVCGIKLPEGLQLASKLPEPIFTPSTKAEQGHDKNISYKEFESLVGINAWFLRDISLALYESARDYALRKGIAILDTKFEFGKVEYEKIVIDEALTPDSSRFSPAEVIVPGQAPPSMDKQYVRDYVTSLGWDKKPPAPELPDSVVRETQRRYFEIFEKLTGRDPMELFR